MAESITEIEIYKTGDRVKALKQVGGGDKDAIGALGTVISSGNGTITVSWDIDQDVSGWFNDDTNKNCWHCTPEMITHTTAKKRKERQKLKFKKGEYIIINPNSGFAKQGEGLVGLIVQADITKNYPYQVEWCGKEGRGRYGYSENDILPFKGDLIPKDYKYKVGDTIKCIDKYSSAYHYSGTITELRPGKVLVITFANGDSRITHDTNIKDIKECPNPLPLQCHECTKVCKSEEQSVTHEKMIIERDKKIKVITEKEENIPVYLSKRLNLYIHEELKEFINTGREYPLLYLMGAKELGGIIEALVILRGYGGCKDMQHISPYEFMIAKKYIHKQKFVPVGIMRIGRSEGTYGVKEMSSMLGIQGTVITIRKEKIYATRYDIIDGEGFFIDKKVIIIEKSKDRKEVKNDEEKSSSEEIQGK